MRKKVYHLDKHPELPSSYYTGVLGIAGGTAYTAFKAFAADKVKEVKDSILKLTSEG